MRYLDMKSILTSTLILIACCLCMGQQVTSTAPPRPTLEQMADSGDLRAMYHLSAILERGDATHQADTVLSLQLLRRSAEGGYAPAMNYLGYAYGSGILGLEQSADSMLYWIERAASAPEPDPKAFNNLGILLLTGQGGVQRDYTKARYWLQRGAESGIPSATASLAHIYLQGLGVEPDTAMALPLLRSAAQRGLSEPANTLAGIVVPQLLQMPPEAAYEAAMPYYHEYILPVAVPVIRYAADASVPQAVATLAQCYAQGLGVEYDYNKAIALYARAAAMGSPHAQYIIAETMQTFPDLEVFDSLPSAEELYEIAAAAGITSAESALRPLRP